jgi:hypothetical protein
MSAPENEDDSDGGNGGSSTGVTRVMAVLTAAAGLSALVAFTGAAIVWVRFEEAELPAEQAVAVTIGAGAPHGGSRVRARMVVE